MLTHARLLQVLRYAPETGIFRWANGLVAGSLHSKGYRRVMVDKKEYLEHRLGWFYHHGEWPREQIDHINGDKSDNRLANLRLSSHSENERNRPKMRNNKSGHKGVSWHKGNQRWRAQITLHHNDIFLGYFATPEEAADTYNKAALKYHGEFAKIDL